MADPETSIDFMKKSMNTFSMHSSMFPVFIMVLIFSWILDSKARWSLSSDASKSPFPSASAALNKFLKWVTSR